MGWEYWHGLSVCVNIQGRSEGRWWLRGVEEAVWQQGLLCLHPHAQLCTTKSSLAIGLKTHTSTHQTHRKTAQVHPQSQPPLQASSLCQTSSEPFTDGKVV